MIYEFRVLPLQFKNRAIEKFMKANHVKQVENLSLMRILAALLLLMLTVGCSNTSKLEKEIAAIPMTVDIDRFDITFSKATPDQLPVLKQQYPQFFPRQYNDSIWLARMSDTLQLALNNAVQAEFPDNTKIEDQLYPLFQHLEYYFPEFESPQIVTVISDVDYRNKVIASDSLLIIGLDNYLGVDHPLYEGVKRYVVKTLKPSQIGPDVVKTYSRQLIAIPKNRDFLAQIVYFGKELYLKDILLPELSDAEKLGYTEAEYQWALENESDIWRYFVEKEILYSTDPRLPGRFINAAPFSKFYLEIDNESPGQIGRFIGWQIVRAYMNNNDTDINSLLSENASTIFSLSKYKPAK